MTYQDKKLIKTIFRQSLIVFGCIMACRFTHGLASLAIAVYGVWAAFNHKVSAAICCFLMFPFLRIVNRSIIAGGVNGGILTIGLVAICIGLCMSGSRRAGRDVLPVGMMVGYLLVASISSIAGYAPFVSFMKIINFSAILFGLWLGLKNLPSMPEVAFKVRLMFLGMTAFVVGGSILTVLFPAYGYANEVDRLSQYGMSLSEIGSSIASNSGMLLFSGVTCQSQVLAIVLPCSIAWLLCDMLFIEKRITLIHSTLIFFGLPLIYMTRARVALVTTLALVWMIYFYCVGRIPISLRLKRAIKMGMTGAIVLAFCGAVYSEISSHGVSKWIRKTDDVIGDQRSLGEAFSSSRQGLMKESMSDFKANPIFGKGFQVDWRTPIITGGGFALSAPIEKGVLPVMILGETGILGAIAFLVFLGAFYGGCFRRKYVVTATLFTAFLATNLGEATFFSPGGAGGILWALCAGGGFVIDSLVIAQKQMKGKGPNGLLPFYPEFPRSITIDAV